METFDPKGNSLDPGGFLVNTHGTKGKNSKVRTVRKRLLRTYLETRLNSYIDYSVPSDTHYVADLPFGTKYSHTGSGA